MVVYSSVPMQFFVKVETQVTSEEHPLPYKSLRIKDSLEALDIDLLQTLKGLEKPTDTVPFLKDLVDTFIRESPEVLNRLVSALAVKDASVALHAAHQLKGLSGNLGLMRLAALSELIEDEVEERRLPDSTEAKTLLECYRKEAIESLERDWL